MTDRTRRRFGVEDEAPESQTGTGVAIIGLGAVGSSLARSLYRTNYRLLALINRSIEIARRIASEVGSPIVSSSVSDIPDEVRFVFICTREDNFATVVDDLLASDLELGQSVVAHVSGRETSAVLSPLADRGAHTLSFHPLGAFPPGNTRKTFAGLTIGLEGDALAVAVGKTVAVDLGAVPVEIPASAKAAYHLAAAVTSNFLVTLLGDVERLLAASDLPAGLTQSLAEDTLENLRSSSPERALTGPIVRGDRAALEDQIRTLVRIAPELLPRFLALADGTIELALRGGRISAAEGAALRGILERAIVP